VQVCIDGLHVLVCMRGVYVQVCIDGVYVLVCIESVQECPEMTSAMYLQCVCNDSVCAMN